MEHPSEYYEHDGEMRLDPIAQLGRTVPAALRKLHADPKGEWAATITPLIVFLGQAVHSLAALSGEREGIAAMYDAGVGEEA